MVTSRNLVALVATLGAVAIARPVSAQYYPGYGYGYAQPNAGNVVGDVLNDMLGDRYGYRTNSQILVNECASAAQARVGDYGAYGPRVLGISGVSRRGDGGITVRGVATSGRLPYGTPGFVDLSWQCVADYRGVVRDVMVNGSAAPRYGYDRNYVPWDNDYSQYGYRRY